MFRTAFIFEVFGTIGNFPLQNHGTIIKCLETSGPAVISASTAAKAMYINLSGVYVVLRNLDVRTDNNPAINGIDLANSAQCRLENIFINTGIYNVQASKPTHGTKALITPLTNNAWQTTINDVHDPDNLGVADISHWVVVGNVGARDDFTMKGGAHIRARRIGEDSAPAGLQE